MCETRPYMYSKCFGQLNYPWQFTNPGQIVNVDKWNCCDVSAT